MVRVRVIVMVIVRARVREGAPACLPVHIAQKKFCLILVFTVFFNLCFTKLYIVNVPFGVLIITRIFSSLPFSALI